MVIEVVTFRLADEVEESALLEADYRFQTEFIPNHPGFLRRTTAKAPDGEWIVVMLWGTEESAEASGELGLNDPVAQRFNALIEQETVRRKLYSTLD